MGYRFSVARRITSLSLLVLAFALPAASASAWQSGLTVNAPSLLSANAAASYSASAIANNGEAIGRAVFTLPKNCDVSGVTAALTMGTTPISPITVTTDTVGDLVSITCTFTTPNGSGTNRTFKATLSNIVNPSVAGNYTYSVAFTDTASSTISATSSSFAIAANTSAPSVGTVGTGSVRAGVVTTYTVPVTVGAQGRLASTAMPGGVLTANTISVTFPSGYAVPGVVPANSLTLNGSNVTSASVTGNTVKMSIPSGVTVPNSGVATIVFKPSFGIANPPTGSYALQVTTDAQTGTGTSPSLSIADGTHVAIAQPTAGAVLSGGSYNIQGTADDTGPGLSKVELMILRSDGQYWNGTNGWGGTGWFTASGTSAWSYNWPLPADDHAYTYTISTRATAVDGAVSTVASVLNLSIDNIAPSGGTVSIDAGATYATSRSVMLSLSASDGGTVANMLLSNDGSTWSGPVAYTSSYAYTLPAGDGAKTVYVRFVDAAGNTGTAVSDTITLDTTAPSGTVTINGGAAHTNNRAVTLGISASDAGSSVSQMQFSTDGSSWGTAVSYATTYAYTLPAGDGAKTVYVRFIDGAGNTGGSTSDGITLDTTDPSGTISVNGGAAFTNATAVTLTLSASDAGSGVSQMQFSNDGLSWGSPVAYATSYAYTLPAGDGAKTVYARFIDGAGNTGSSASDPITLDTTAPTGTVIVNSGAAYATSRNVMLTLAASDAGSVAFMQFSDNGSSWGTAVAYATTYAYTLPAGDGAKTVYVRFIDGAGNTGPSTNDAIVLDATAPSGTVTVNAGASYATTTAVTLTLSATDAGSGLTSMQFSNDGSAWSATVPYATGHAYTLPAGDGAKTVYVRFIDGAGNVGPSTSDAIVVDTHGPTGSVTINGGAASTNLASVTLALSATDADSGVTSMQFSNDGSIWSAPMGYATSSAYLLPAGDGSKTVYVRFIDGAGNTGASTSDAIVLDTGAPSGTISINAGATFTKTTSTALTLSATDNGSVTDMRFSNDGSSWSAWEAYAVSKAYTLPAGDGTKSVYVEYRDNSGNVSAPQSSAIVLDTTLPTGTISINGGALYATSLNLALTLAASDVGSGVNQMQFSENGSTWGSPVTYAASQAYTLTAGEGVRLLYVRFIDAAANTGASANDTVTVDTVRPTVMSATSVDATHVDVIFSENVSGVPANGAGFTIAGLTVSAASASANTVHLTTTAQAAVSYTVNVAAGAGSDPAGNQNTAGSAAFAGQAPPVTSLVAPVLTTTYVGFLTSPAGWATALGWTASSGATAYEMHDASTDALIASTASLNATETGLSTGAHSYYVVATAGAIRSPRSNTVTATFATVPTAGQQAPPSGMRLLPSAYCNVSAPDHVGSVNVTLLYNPSEVAGDASRLRMMHYTGGSWQDITTSVDTVNHVVHGTTTSFSDFAIFEPTAVAPVTSTPASSEWSLALLVLAGVGSVAGMTLRKRL